MFVSAPTTCKIQNTFNFGEGGGRGRGVDQEKIRKNNCIKNTPESIEMFVSVRFRSKYYAAWKHPSGTTSFYLPKNHQCEFYCMTF